MAKAAVNMLTRTSAQEMFETDGILMSAPLAESSRATRRP
jgi:hypothetical protein